MARTVDQLCRVRFVPKNADAFRMKTRDLGTVGYVTTDQFLIGSSKEADIAFNGSGVAPQHLRVRVQGNEVWLEVLSGDASTLVSGRPVPPGTPFPYVPGEVIQLGQADHILTIDVFGRLWQPDQESEAIVRRARESVEAFEQRRKGLKAEIQAALDQLQVQKTAIENNARLEAERILAEAHRQVQEKSRQAIEDGHAQAEALQKQATTEAERIKRQAIEHAQSVTRTQEAEASKIVTRAESTAQGLVASAKSEVDRILTEARLKAEAVANEGLDRKQAAQAEADVLNSNMSLLQEEKAKLEADTAQSKSIYEEAVRKRETLLKQVAEVEAEHGKAKTALESLRVETSKLEKESHTRLQSLQNEYQQVEAKTAESLRSREQAEKHREQLLKEKQQLHAELDGLEKKKSGINQEIAAAGEKKAHAINEIKQLDVQYQAELGKLRERVDEEYSRQLKEQLAYFRELREREAQEQSIFLKRMEEIDHRRLNDQIQSVGDRLWWLVADRSALYGMPDLKENKEFKADVRNAVNQALIEDFEFRRKEVLAAREAAPVERRRQQLVNKTVRYTGWAMSFCLLGFLLYSQVFSSSAAVREPASTLTPKTTRAQDRPQSIKSRSSDQASVAAADEAAVAQPAAATTAPIVSKPALNN